MCKFFTVEDKLKIGFKGYKGMSHAKMRRILETDSKSFPYNISLKLVLRATRECPMEEYLKSILSVFYRI